MYIYICTVENIWGGANEPRGDRCGQLLIFLYDFYFSCMRGTYYNNNKRERKENASAECIKIK